MLIGKKIKKALAIDRGNRIIHFIATLILLGTRMMKDAFVALSFCR